MASFKARIGRKRPRKTENKYCRYVSFLPHALYKIPEIKQNNSKKKKKQLWLHFKPKSVERG